MFKYLGESSSEFHSLVDKSIENNEIQKFDISNEKGKFSGFKVDSGNDSGYAYYHLGGDFYEFVSEDACTVEPKEMLKIAQKELVPFAKLEKAYLENRNEETKTIDIHEISFTNNNFHNKTTKAISAKINGEDGFIFKEASYGSFSASQDVVKNYFVKSSEVSDLGLINSQPLLTQKEQAELNRLQQESLFEKNKKILEGFGVKVLNINPKTYMFNHATSLVESLNTTKEEISGTYKDARELLVKMTEIRADREAVRVDKELEKIGIKVEIKTDVDADTMIFSIKTKTGKELSSLSLDNIVSDSVSIEFTNDDREQDEMVFPMIVLDLENNQEIDDRKFELKENGKVISLEKSKFKSIYEVFNLEAFVLDYEENALADKEYLENEYGDEYPISDIDITNSRNVSSFLLETIKQDETIEKELKSALGQNKKRNSLRK